MVVKQIITIYNTITTPIMLQDRGKTALCVGNVTTRMS